MKVIFKFVLFMVFFNLAAVFVASLQIFPTTVYSDLYVMEDDIPNDLSDPDNLPGEFEVIARFLSNTPQFGEELKIAGYTIDLTFWGIVVVAMGGIAAASIVLQSVNPVLGGIAVMLFVFMYLNSKSLFDQLLDNQPGSVNYLILMISVGVIIMFLISVFDYAAGQSSG